MPSLAPWVVTMIDLRNQVEDANGVLICRPAQESQRCTLLKGSQEGRSSAASIRTKK
jgi:hypothetical protein